MSILKGQLQTDTADVLYPHTSSDVVFDPSSGKSVAEQISNLSQQTKTYAELQTLVSQNKLIPGCKYILSNYQTKYRQPDTNVIKTMSAERLVLTAVAANQFDIMCSSLDFPNDVIYYNFNLNICEDGTTARNGFILRRIDDSSGVTLDFVHDWRKMLWARYRPNQTQYLLNGTLTNYLVWTSGAAVLNRVYKSGNTLYMAKNTDVPTNATDTNVFFVIYEDISIGRLIAHTRVGVGCVLQKSALYTEHPTFGTACSRISIGEILYGAHNSVYYLANTVIGDNCHSISFGNGCLSNTIGNQCAYMSFGNSSQRNLVGSGATGNIFENITYDNFLGVGCVGNVFGNTCSDNVLSSNCYYNQFGSGNVANTLGFGATGNVFGSGCHTNVLGNSNNYNRFASCCYANNLSYGCYDNDFGPNCYENTFSKVVYSTQLGCNCYSNNIGDTAGLNSFGNGCFGNVTGSNFFMNRLGNDCYNNNFGAYAMSNDIGNDCHDNTLGSSCHHNQMGDGFHSNTLGNDCTTNVFAEFVYGNNFGVNFALNIVKALRNKNVSSIPTLLSNVTTITIECRADNNFVYWYVNASNVAVYTLIP